MNNMLLNKNSKQVLNELIKQKNSRVYGREIAKRYKMNQKTVANILNKLEEEDLLKYTIEGKNKYYFLNGFNPLIKELVQTIEVEKKADFLKSHKNIAELIRKIEQKSEGIVVLFGSYAKGAEDKESDLDLFVIGKSNSDDLEKDFGKKINMVKSTKEKFDINNPFIKEVLRNHIVLKGVEEFVNLTW